MFIPISGWVADRYGAKNVFRGAIVVFLTGSILCGLSSSLWQLVAARMLQGLGGAMMVPVGRLVLLRSVTKADMVGAMAWLTVPALIGPVIGPLLGGFITTYFHWRWIFWINVPIAVLGLVLVTLFIPARREPRPPAFDSLGFVLTAAGLVGLMFGFETIGRDIVPGWASALLLVAGGVCIMLFVLHASRIAHPVLDLNLLRVPTFRASVTGGFLFRMGIGALPFLLPLAAAGGLRPQRLRIGATDLRRRPGRPHHEVRGQADPAPVRFPARASRQCLPQRALPGGDRPVPPGHASRPDPGGAAHRRLLPLAAVHQHQHAGLCRHRPAAHEPGHQLRQHGAAAVAERGRGNGRHHPAR